MILKKILILALFLMIATQASALSIQTNRYIATTAFPTNPCTEKLLDGAEAPSKSANWIANPDFKPQNWLCYSNDQNCAARMIAQKYLQNAITETDQCKKSYNQGIYSTFTSFSETPSNWLNIEPTCKSNFETEIETKITTFETTWQIIKECPILGEEGTISLNYSNEDLNRVILSIRTNWETQNKDLNFLTPIQITEEEKTNLYEIIQALKDQNKIVGTETINKQALLDLWDYSCFLSENRIIELEEKWKQLDYTSKSCLPIYLAQKTATAYSLVANCPQLGAGTGYSQQALSSAQYALTQYTSLGFGETKCRKISIPVYIGGDQFTQQQDTSTMPEYCEFAPKNIPQGCIQRFQHNEEQTTNAYNDGMAAGTAIILILFAIIGTFVYINHTGG